MMDVQTVCCMCGDVGFPDKLFHCSKCRNRSQHSYCSNYYSEHAEPIEVCDWCQCEEKNSSKHKSAHATYSAGGEKVKQQHHREEGGSSAEKAAGKAPSPRPSTRRYKLLKDVMC
ncbi:hypothetical protein ACS0TY_019608 [Phlomoides rotata]